MKTFPRALATFVAIALTLAASAALAVEYDEIISLTREGTSTRTIMELIVQDGRAFEMSDDELQRLEDAGVDADVIRAMQDPAYAQTWLDNDGPLVDDNGNTAPEGGGGGGYQSDLDRAYGQGYSDGQTSLVYSFGYYYGPLSRYYYVDPFYYSFWFSGSWGIGYWPSYCAYYYRPAYAWCSPYPYNYYNYSSYYCNTYYDPGYYRANGYTVPNGGRSIYDTSPRWRDGGVNAGATVTNRQALADLGGRSAGRPASPPVVRGIDKGLSRGRDLVASTGMRNGRVSRDITPTNPGAASRGYRSDVSQRTPGTVTRSGDVSQRSPGTVTRGGSRIDRSAGDMQRGNEAGRMVREGRTPRAGGSDVQRSTERSWMPRRNDGSTYGVRRVGGSERQDMQPGRRQGSGNASRGVRRFDESGMGQVLNSRRSARGDGYDPGRSAQRMAPPSYRSAPQSRGNGGGTQMRGNGGGGAPQARGGGAQVRGGNGGGGGGGAPQARGGGAQMRGGGGHGGGRG